MRAFNARIRSIEVLTKASEPRKRSKISAISVGELASKMNPWPSSVFSNSGRLDTATGFSNCMASSMGPEFCSNNDGTTTMRLA